MTLGSLSAARGFASVMLCTHLFHVNTWFCLIPPQHKLYSYFRYLLTCSVSLAAAGTAKASQKTAPQRNLGSKGSPSSSLQRLPNLSSALPATAGPSTTGSWKGSNASTPTARSSVTSSTVKTTGKTTKEKTYGFFGFHFHFFGNRFTFPHADAGWICRTFERGEGRGG